jgi:hypothetical protein
VARNLLLTKSEALGKLLLVCRRGTPRFDLVTRLVWNLLYIINLLFLWELGMSKRSYCGTLSDIQRCLYHTRLFDPRLLSGFCGLALIQKFKSTLGLR